MNSDYNSRLFQDPRTFPSRETGDPPSGPSSYPVIRVKSRFPGLKTRHVRMALKSFLAARGATLPPDTGAGPCVVTVRLEPAALAKAMRLAGESNRSALIRRLIYWRFYQRAEAEAAKRAAKQPVAPVAEKHAAPRAKTLESPATDGNRSYLGVPPSL